MPVSLPYLPSNKNLEALFTKIQSAKIPEKFNREFLQTTIGLKGSNDRPLIPLLRTLGFVDQSGAPTASYRLLKNNESAKAAIGSAVRQAYAPLFESDEQVHRLTGDKLKGLIAQVAGTDDDMTARIAQTFTALVKVASFDAIPEKEDEDQENELEEVGVEEARTRRIPGVGDKTLRPEFHYNIQVHLPSNGTEQTYLSIFNALRKAFQ